VDTVTRAAVADAGLPIDVLRVGAGDPIVLLHGFGASRFTWRSWIPELSRDHAVYQVDLRGFGAGRKLDEPCYGPADMADDVVGLIHQLDLERITLVGHSMGGGVALMVALRLIDAGEGSRLARLISVSGTAYPQSLPPMVSRLSDPSLILKLILRVLPARRIVRRVLRSIVYDPAIVTDEMVEGYASPFGTWPARRAAAACAAQLVPEDVDALAARYPEIDVPALLVWGRQDPVVPLPIGERLATALPRASLIVLERCGHAPMEEMPAELLRVVSGFLTDGAAAKPAAGQRAGGSSSR
jgi:pimeloyl-ACP methyl ester carboxylesterase